MKYFSGFCFENEYHLFKDIAKLEVNNDYLVCGFSFGAIGAFEYALKCDKRIDKLILISPAFFNDKNLKFKELQTIGFDMDMDKYIDTFLQNIQKPYSNEQIYQYVKKPNKENGMEQLKEMLYYNWDNEKLNILKEKGIMIEVYFGSLDRIVATKKAKDFFMPYCDVYMINDVNHILND